jgi:hypothetical protein
VLHSPAAAAAEMGFSELTIAGLLGHSVPGVTARYAHVPNRTLLAAADQVSRHIEAVLVGETGADVIELDPQRARS